MAHNDVCGVFYYSYYGSEVIFWVYSLFIEKDYGINLLRWV